MASQYIWGMNPIQDLLMGAIMGNIDISDKRAKTNINSNFERILCEYMNINSEDLLYLDFEIIKDKSKYELIGKNMISAMWFCCMVSENPEETLKDNNFIIDDKKYVYNKKNHKLTYKLMNKKIKYLRMYPFCERD